MAKLELVPDVVQVVFQMGVIVAASAVVKRYFILPYFDLKHKREQSTLGLSESSKELENKCSLINQEIDVEISQALEKVRSQGDLRKEGVVRKSTQAQTQAYQQAEKKITKFQELLAVRLEEQEARVSQEAKRITQVLFSELSKA
jgi:hypothetical protein